MNPPEGQLDSWKAIAAYLGRGVTTVQRWEQSEGLPVHRLPHARSHSVFAFTHELDAWKASRAQALAAARPGHPRDSDVEEDAGTAPAEMPANGPSSQRRAVWMVALSGLVAGALMLTAILGRDSEPPTSVPPDADPAAPRPLANDRGLERGPSLSPDGRHVVFDWAQGDEHGLFIKPTDGGEAHRLALPDGVRLPDSARSHWSPDGSLIAFLAVDAPDVYRLYVVGPDGSGLRLVTHMAGIGLCWHPDGSTIGFADRTAAGEPFSIYSVALGTGERRRLTEPPPSAFGDTYCTFSPDGARLAVVRHETRHASDVYAGDLPRSGQVQVSRLTQGMQGIGGIAWSPEGQWILAGANGLWKIAAQGTGVRTPIPVTAVEGAVRSPSFSVPDDSPARLAYAFEIQDVNIWRWDRGPSLTGAGSVRDLPGSVVWENLAAFSPDGRHLAFVSNRTGTVQIWTMSADGSEVRQVTFHGPLAISPQWSPDGRSIAFAALAGDNWDVYVVRSDASGSRRLTWDPSQDENPSWSADGKWVYFRSDRGGRGHIWKMPAAGGAALQVTRGEGSEAVESPDGQTLYFIRADNARGLWSMPAAGGPESLLLPDVGQDMWALADEGIAYLAAPATGPPEIRWFDLDLRTTSVLTRLPDGPVQPGFSMTRDGRTAVWSRTDRQLHDVMIIDAWTP